jgi:hypothetical protein
LRAYTNEEQGHVCEALLMLVTMLRLHDDH